MESVEFLVDRGVSLDWLATGEGSMMKIDDQELRNTIVHQGRFADAVSSCLEYLGEQGRELRPDKAGPLFLATFLAAEREFEREQGNMSSADYRACIRRILQIHDALTD